MRERYDVVVIGAGPAGVFCALEIAEGSDLSVAILERGPDLPARQEAVRARTRPRGLSPMMCGWGGAGAFSDGKLTLSPRIGGHLAEYVGEEAAERLLGDVDAAFLRFGAPDHVYGADPERADEVARRAAQAELLLIHTRLRHLGTDRTVNVLSAMRDALDPRVEIYTDTAVEHFGPRSDGTLEVELAGGTSVRCRHLVVAPGRSGAEWLISEARRLNLTRERNPVDLGVRVEIPAAILDDLTKDFYELKLLYYAKTFDTRVRTFCMCPYGEVVAEKYGSVTLVNGHSYARRRSENTNFALLVSSTFTEPFDDPIAYGENIARLANLLAGGVLVQRLSDLHRGRRSTPDRLAQSIVRPTLPSATPGDLSFALPYRHLVCIVEMLEALDRFAAGMGSRHALLYGVEAKFYSARPKLNDCFETEVPNLFAVGDGAGVTRGLTQAAATGLVAGREILRRN